MSLDMSMCDDSNAEEEEGVRCLAARRQELRMEDRDAGSRARPSRIRCR